MLKNKKFRFFRIRIVYKNNNYNHSKKLIMVVMAKEIIKIKGVLRLVRGEIK